VLNYAKFTFSRKWYKQENLPDDGGYNRIGLVALAATAVRYHKTISYPHLDIHVIGTPSYPCIYTRVNHCWSWVFRQVRKATKSDY
jgi:hypothetical protein